MLNRGKLHLDTYMGEFLESLYWKDTKNKRTWWCFTAPHNPTTATTKRKNPTAMTAAITLKLETSPNHLPHAATPINRRLTIWKQKSNQKLLRKGRAILLNHQYQHKDSHKHSFYNLQTCLMYMCHVCTMYHSKGWK